MGTKSQKSETGAHCRRQRGEPAGGGGRTAPISKPRRWATRSKTCQSRAPGGIAQALRAAAPASIAGYACGGPGHHRKSDQEVQIEVRERAETEKQWRQCVNEMRSPGGSATRCTARLVGASGLTRHASALQPELEAIVSWQMLQMMLNSEPLPSAGHLPRYPGPTLGAPSGNLAAGVEVLRPVVWESGGGKGGGA